MTSPHHRWDHRQRQRGEGCSSHNRLQIIFFMSTRRDRLREFGEAGKRGEKKSAAEHRGGASAALAKSVDLHAPTFQSSAAAERGAETMPHFHPEVTADRFAMQADALWKNHSRARAARRARTPRSENAVFRAPQRRSRDLGPLRRFFGYFSALSQKYERLRDGFLADRAHTCERSESGFAV